MSENRIYIVLRGDDYWAIWAGPHAAQILALFGDNELVTAYHRAMPVETVVAAIQAKNPDCEVIHIRSKTTEEVDNENHHMPKMLVSKRQRL